MSEIEEIKARLDILDIVSENVQLKRSGKNYTGFCPFHANTRTPAFVVWPDTGTWRCFGECNDGGDIFKYVMKRDGWKNMTTCASCWKMPQLTSATNYSTTRQERSPWITSITAG